MQLLKPSAVINIFLRTNILFGLLVGSTSCADLTKPGSKVYYIESSKGLLDMKDQADTLVLEHNCRFLEFINSDTSKFPGSYSLHENEVHSALKNRTAHIGGNLLIANFYKKPAEGVALTCPEEYLKEHVF